MPCHPMWQDIGQLTYRQILRYTIRRRVYNKINHHDMYVSSAIFLLYVQEGIYLALESTDVMTKR